MTRQFFFDAWHYLFLGEQQRSLDLRLAEIAAKALKEVAYHLERSRDWIVRLGDGTGESHRRAQRAVDLLWPFTGEAFELDDVDRALLEPGIGVDVAALRQPWLGLVGATLDEATLARPTPTPGCRRAASAAGTASIWATCWRRCSSSSAPIQGRAGEPDGVRGTGLGLAGRGP